MVEAGELRELFHHARIARFLQCHEVRLCRRDHLGELLGASCAAFTDVVGEEPHGQSRDSDVVSSSSGFLRSTRYGWSITTSRRYCTNDVVAWMFTGRLTMAQSCLRRLP